MIITYGMRSAAVRKRMEDIKSARRTENRQQKKEAERAEKEAERAAMEE